MKPNNVQTVLMLLMALCTTPCVGQSLSRADRPEVKVGDTWVYQDRDARTGEKRELSFLVTLVDGDRIVTETGQLFTILEQLFVSPRTSWSQRDPL